MLTNEHYSITYCDSSTVFTVADPLRADLMDAFSTGTSDFDFRTHAVFLPT